MPRRVLPVVALAFALGGTVSARAAESVVVELASGRVFSGQIDLRTSPRSLVLRSGVRGMTITRPIDWNRVVRVRIDGKPLTAAELIERFERDGWPTQNEELPEPPAPSPPPAARPPGPSEEFENEAGSEIPAPRVRSLQVEASIGRWSTGVDHDGIVVRVYPLDGDGNIVPVSGNLEVELIGQQPAAQTYIEPFPQLARWGQQLDARDVGFNGEVFRLPFQAWHPDVDLQLSGWGAVHVRLSVPGQGVFDDTATMVRTRAYDATRDRLQQFKGKRYFPQERTTQGTNDSAASLYEP